MCTDLTIICFSRFVSISEPSFYVYAVRRVLHEPQYTKLRKLVLAILILSVLRTHASFMVVKFSLLTFLLPLRKRISYRRAIKVL